MSLNLEVTLEMIHRGCGSSSSAATTWLSSQMYLDPADYDGATYYFEILGRNGHATIDYTVDLMEGANVMASHVLTHAIPAGAGDYLRMRSSSFVPTSGAQIYQLRTPQTAVASNVTILAARIVVVQVNATITRLQFPLASTSGTSSLDTLGVPLHQSASTTYAQSTPVNCSLWKLERSLLATIAAGSPWSWETVGAASTVSTSVALFDATGNVQIGSFANVHSSGTATIATQNFADSLLTDLNDLEVRVKSGHATSSASLQAANLYVRLTTLTKAVVVRRVGLATAGITATVTKAEARQRIDASPFSSPVIYFEGTGWESSAGTVVMDLNDQSTADNGVGAGSNVASSTLTFDGATKIRQRTAALTLTSDNRYTVRYTRTSGTLQSAGAVLLIVAEQSTVAYTYSGTAALVAGDLAPLEYGHIPATSGLAAILGATGGLAAIAVPEATGVGLIAGMPSGVLAGSTVGTVMGPVVLVSVYLDSGTEYAAAAEVRHPSRLYEGRVISCGTVERSIPIPVGLPSVGHLTITFADTDHYWRGVLSQRTPYRRLLEVKIGVEGGSEILFMTAYRGEVRSVHFEQENVSIEAADITARWLDNPIPPLINRTNFPNSAVADAFFPIVLGGVTDPRIPPTGAVTCYLIDTTLNRYSVSRTPSTVLALYKKISGSTLSPAVSGDVWVLIDPADYTVSEINQTIDGVDYDYTVVDLAVSIDTGSPIVYGGTEVRADINGTQGRGAFGSMPGVTGTLRNPIDALINMSYYGFLAANQVVRFDTASFETVHAQMEALAWYCDGAIVDPMTFREFLGQFLPCFSLDLYQNRRAELAVKLTVGEDPDRPVFNDLEHILRGSVRQDLPDPCFNRIVYKWAKIYSDNHFENTTVFNNEADQDETILLDEDPPTPKIQSETVELHFIRDAATGAAVIEERSRYQALGSYRFHCDLSAPQVLDLVDLASRIGITHAGGIAPGGWVNEEFKVYRESLNLDDLRVTISGIRRYAPLSIVGGVLSFEMIDNGAASQGYGAFRPIFSMTSLTSTDFDGDTWYFEIVAANNHTTESYEVRLKDGAGATVATISVPPNTGTTPTLYRSSSFALTPGASMYQVELEQTAINANVHVYTARMLVALASSTKAVSQIPLTSGAYSMVAFAEGSIAYTASRAFFDVDPTEAETRPEHFTRFLFTASNWATIDAVVLEIIWQIFPYWNESLTFFLYDLTAAANVSGSEIIRTTADWVAGNIPSYASVVLPPGALIDGHEYELRATYVGLNETQHTHGALYKGRLSIKLTSLTKAEIYLLVSKSTGAMGPVEHARFKFGSANYGNSRFYLEGTGIATTTPENYYAELVYDGANTSGIAGAAVTAARLDFPTGKNRLRTSVLPLVDGHYTYLQTRVTGGGSITTTDAFILVCADWT